MIGAGNVGGNLGGRLSHAGVSLRFGVRPGTDASEVLARCADGTEATSPEEAAGWAEVVFLAVPGRVLLEAARALGSLEGKTLVDCTNAVRFDGGPVWAPPDEGSNAQALAAAFPNAHVVKAFNTFGAEIHKDPTTSAGPADVPMAGDDEAVARVAALAESAGFRPVPSGPLRNAPVLENLAVLWIHLAMVGGHGRETAFKLVGR